MSLTSRLFARAWYWLAPCGVAILIAAPTWAANVVRVEEHWELRLAQPDQDRSAPQTTMVVSPDGDLEGAHFLFTLNHSNVPSYEPGGMQVQLWDGDELLDHHAADELGALAHADEVVTWVHGLSLEDGTLTFGIADGQSETWGEFGGDDLSLSTATSLTNLNGYMPGVSITESQVGYAENRVVSLTLTKLVWYTDDGEVHELNAPIAVDTSLDE
ncbi:MAG: hypothetical protein WD738_11075 [Pirellulales bacterium]